MTMYVVAHKLHEEVKTHFPELTDRQIWTIVKLCKMSRRYCRSNAAFNNAMNVVFEGIAEFKEVQKINPKDGTSYPGLSIRVKGKDTEIESNESED